MFEEDLETLKRIGKATTYSNEIQKESDDALSKITFNLKNHNINNTSVENFRKVLKNYLSSLKHNLKSSTKEILYEKEFNIFHDELDKLRNKKSIISNNTSFDETIPFDAKKQSKNQNVELKSKNSHYTEKKSSQDEQHRNKLINNNVTANNYNFDRGKMYRGSLHIQLQNVKHCNTLTSQEVQMAYTKQVEESSSNNISTVSRESSNTKIHQDKDVHLTIQNLHESKAQNLNDTVKVCSLESKELPHDTNHILYSLLLILKMNFQVKDESANAENLPANKTHLCNNDDAEKRQHTEDILQEISKKIFINISDVETTLQLNKKAVSDNCRINKILEELHQSCNSFNIELDKRQLKKDAQLQLCIKRNKDLQEKISSYVEQIDDCKAQHQQLQENVEKKDKELQEKISLIEQEMVVQENYETTLTNLSEHIKVIEKHVDNISQATYEEVLKEEEVMFKDECNSVLKDMEDNLNTYELEIDVLRGDNEIRCLDVEEMLHQLIFKCDKLSNMRNDNELKERRKHLIQLIHDLERRLQEKWQKK